ncbi:MAG: polyphosphate kinase 1 [Flavobacteriaceae bacterium]|nr:polyphosphate kinase 1 [Flavobacteriaceae bacterium]
MKDSPYINRDISWLDFNARVLQEAAHADTPLFEKLKFLAIFSSNLDEFFRVRIPQWQTLKQLAKTEPEKEQNAKKILKTLLGTIKKQQEEFGHIYRNLVLPSLQKEGIFISDAKSFTAQQKSFVRTHFRDYLLEKIQERILPCDYDKEIFLENNALYYLVTFENPKYFGLVSIPTKKERFIKLPSDIGVAYCLVDEIVKLHLPQIFIDENVQQAYQIKLTRDAELYLDDDLREEQADLAALILQSLSKRDIGSPTRLLIDGNMPKELRKKVRLLFDLRKADVISGGSFHNFSDFFRFPAPLDGSRFYDKPQTSLMHPLAQSEGNIFEKIRQRDYLLHLPFQSYQPVIHLLQTAAKDARVKQINITLYRVATESAICENLILAAQNGKKVIAVVEPQARFDEANNLKWGKIMQEKGIEVIYGFPGKKVHAKTLLIYRQKKEILEKFAYIGTGNFNENTAKFYVDHGLFTYKKHITEELHRLFELFQNPTINWIPETILVSPFTSRNKLEALIDFEISEAKAGRIACIEAKMNSLEDDKFIDLFVNAAKAGVRVRLLVRGICRLLPDLLGVGKNIEITSIVDRYLEHGRLYHFHHAGNGKLYMGSADLMKRNLDHRIEVLTPIEDPLCYGELMTIFKMQLEDNVKSRIINSDAMNVFVTNTRMVCRSQEAVYDFLKQYS